MNEQDKKKNELTQETQKPERNVIMLSKAVKTITILNLNNLIENDVDILLDEDEMLVFKSIRKFERRQIGTEKGLSKQNKGAELIDILKLKFFPYNNGYKVLKRLTGQNPSMQRTFQTGRLIEVFCFDNEIEPTPEGIEGTFYCFHRDGNKTETTFSDYFVKFDGLITTEKINLSEQLATAEDVEEPTTETYGTIGQ